MSAVPEQLQCFDLCQQLESFSFQQLPGFELSHLKARTRFCSRLSYCVPNRSLDRDSDRNRDIDRDTPPELPEDNLCPSLAKENNSNYLNYI